MIIISDECKRTYPGAYVGLLVMDDIQNLPYNEALERQKQELQNSLRNRFKGYSKRDLKNIELIKKYSNYYKGFKKTYHVLLQLESVALKNKSIPTLSTLIETMFMAELKNFLLSAVHDLESVNFPITLDVAKGVEKYITINRQEQQLSAKDLFIADQEGIISSIIYGPDYRTRIRQKTKDAIYVVYAVPGIEESIVLNHLNDIKEYVRLFSPEAKVNLLNTYK